MTSDDEDEDEHTLYLTFDIKNRQIEEKAIRNEDEIILWNKKVYDEADNLIREVSLDNNGEQDGVYEFFPPKNNVGTGYKYTSKKLNYLREYVYEYNEKRHWINEVMMNDGEPKYFYDRKIEYY